MAGRHRMIGIRCSVIIRFQRVGDRVERGRVVGCYHDSLLESAATGAAMAQLIRNVKKCVENARKSSHAADTDCCTTVQLNKATTAAAWYSLNSLE